MSNPQDPIKDLSQHWVDDETPYIHADKVRELLNQQEDLDTRKFWNADMTYDMVRVALEENDILKVKIEFGGEKHEIDISGIVSGPIHKVIKERLNK